MRVPPTPTHAAHLLTRAAWVATPAQMDWVQSVGIEAAVDGLLDAHDLTPPPEPTHSGDDELLYSGEALLQWFFELAVGSASPALERLVWFWHGHFATSIEKVEWPSLMFRQFQTLRSGAMGSFLSLVRAITLDPAMNIWLDLEANIAGAPNENYAREMLELFTMGRDNGYTQADVVDLARALTGIQPSGHCHDDRPTGTLVEPDLHDSGVKTLLGVKGRLGVDDVLPLITGRPETHRFIAERLWLRYAGTPIPAEVSAELTARFARAGDTRDLIHALMTHEAFYRPDVRNGLVAAPVESLVRAYRGLAVALQPIDCNGEPDEVVWYSILAGQAPAHPPHVGGWPHNHAWLDVAHSGARSTVGRLLGRHLLDINVNTAPVNRIHNATGPDALVAALGDAFGVIDWSPATTSALHAAGRLCDEERFVASIATAFASPEVTLS